MHFKLIEYAIEHLGRRDDGEDLLDFYARKIKSGEVSESKFKELAGDTATQALHDAMKNLNAATTKTTSGKRPKTADEILAETERMVEHQLRKNLQENLNKERDMTKVIDDDTDEVTPEMVFGGAANRKAGRVDAKAASARYSNERIVGKHAKTGLPVYKQDGKPAELASQRDKAVSGAYLKLLAVKAGLPIPPLTEHDKSLLREACNTEKFCGQIGQDYVTDLSLKGTTLLEDTLSGGSYLNPYVFDNDIITFPLLNSELFPYVDLRDIPRGAEVRGASIKTPTATWNTSEGTSGTLFTTDGLVAQIDTIIHNVDVFIVVGLDTLADAAVDVGAELTALIGERISAELDRAVAVGDGNTMPQGIFAAPSIPVVSSQNMSAGPWLPKDTENLIEAVGKQYRQNRNKASIGFLSNDALYWRIRGILVNATTGDQRRIYGYDYENYMLASRPYRIQNDIGNSQIAFGDLSKYRMWRRMGLQIDFSKQGITLMQQNSAMLHARARFGGKVMDGNAFAICNDAAHI